jgi:hypothetical protein
LSPELRSSEPCRYRLPGARSWPVAVIYLRKCSRCNKSAEPEGIPASCSEADANTRPQVPGQQSAAHAEY